MTKTLEDIRQQIKASKCITYSDVQKIRRLDAKYKTLEQKLKEIQEKHSHTKKLMENEK